MEYNENFHSYYLRYLGIDLQDLQRGKNVFPCSQREKPLNNWYFQHLIVTNINNINAFSIIPEFYNDFSDYIVPFRNMGADELLEMLKIFFDSRIDNYSIRKMYRMTLKNGPENLSLDDIVMKLTKEILMDCLQGTDIDERNKIWSRKKDEVDQGRQYVILDKDRIASYCKVSDIDCNGGNLTVYTNEKYRKKGYGKLVTMGAIKWCIENGVVPIYWVDEKNDASLALAKSLGFKIMSEEIVAGTYRDL